MSTQLPVTKDTFVEADEKTKDALTYDIFNAIYGMQCLQTEKCDKRFIRLEKRKKRDTAQSAGTGFLGGLMGMLGLKWFLS